MEKTYMIAMRFLDVLKKVSDFAKYFASIHVICLKTHNVITGNKKINRLKIVLAEKDKSNNWLAEQLGRDKATISKWCTNTSQPDIETFIKISKLLNVELADLVRIDEVEA